ncbi:hypothetical protein WCP94_000736 (plasmid) [Bilophila wadsworthia]
MGTLCLVAFLYYFIYLKLKGIYFKKGILRRPRLNIFFTIYHPAYGSHLHFC